MLRGRGGLSVGPSWWGQLTDEERKEQNRYRVGRRAGQQVRRLVRCADLRRLLTFTNGGEGGGFPTLRHALLTFGRWYRAEGEALLGASGVVFIAEHGARYGRIHLHAAIRSGYRIPYDDIRASWSRWLEELGYHSASGVHRFHAGDDTGRHARGFHSARVCAAYMAKYLGKSFDAERQEQERRYRAEGVTVPEPERVRGFTLGDVPDALRDTFGPAVEVTPFYDGEGALSGYWFDVGG